MIQNPGKNNPIPEGENETPFWKNTLAIALIIISGICIYSNTFYNPFVFDDINFITQNNPHLHMTQWSWPQIKKALFEAQPSHRFLPKLSFALNYYFGKENPWGFHLVNMILHMGVAMTLFAFVQTMLQLPVSLQAPWGIRDLQSIRLISLSTALIWMAHPIQTNAVTYMCQRMTSMAALFYLLSMTAYVKARMAGIQHHRKKAWAYWTACAGFGVCAVASKENAGMLPVMILLVEWYFFQDLKNIRPHGFLPALLMAGTAISAIALWYLGENPLQRIADSYANREFTLSQRVMTQWRVIGYYLSLMIAPDPNRFHLDHDYPLSLGWGHPPSTVFCFLMMVSMVAAGIHLAKRRRWFSFCIFWCLGNLVIESSIIGIEIIFEHRMYLPSMMLCFFMALIVFRRMQSSVKAFWMLAMLAATLSIASYQRNLIWQDDVSFWADNAVKSPGKARPYQNLAYSYQRKGNFDQAIVHYEKSLQIAPHPVAYFNLGLAYKETSDPLDAVDAFFNALKMGYDTPKVHDNLAQCLTFIGELDEALLHFQKAIQLAPNNTVTRINFEKLQHLLKSCGNAMACVRILADQQPDNLALSFKLAALTERNGNTAEAKAIYESILARLSRHTGRKLHRLTLNRLAMRYAADGDIPRALELFQKGVDLTPNHPYFYYQIAALYAGMDDSASALHWLKASVRRGFDGWRQIDHDSRWEKIKNSKQFQDIKNKSADVWKQR